MSALVRICAKGELPRPGEAREFSAGRRTLCIANIDGVIRALDNECPHRGGPLAEGKLLDGDCVECPWHGSQFSMADGSVAQGPATVSAHVFETRIRDGNVEVRRR